MKSLWPRTARSRLWPDARSFDCHAAKPLCLRSPLQTVGSSDGTAQSADSDENGGNIVHEAATTPGVSI